MLLLPLSVEAFSLVPLSLDINLGSKHLRKGTSEESNEYNYGLGITYDSYSLGFYENSHEHTSIYLLKTYDTPSSFGSYGFTLGGVTHYTLAITPVIMPYLSFEISRDTRFNIGLAGNVITFGLKIHFGDE